MMTPKSYRSYRDLPAIAGICSVPEAARIGLSVDACVTRLKRHHWAMKRLHEVLVARIPSEPIYEIKMGLSLHAHYCAEHAAAWRRRVGEMREPPLGLDHSPDAALDVFFDEVAASPDTAALLLSLYEHAVPALQAALSDHMAKTNRLVDHPSFRICRFALLELEEMLDFGDQCIAKLVTPARRLELADWVGSLIELLGQAGGLDGSGEVRKGSPKRLFSATPHPFDGVPKRDERFPDPYNMGVHAEAFLYDPKFPPEPKTLMMYYKRLREIDVPEMMASIIAETKGKPWAYYVDMTRQLWDEARHAMMGEVGFIQAGVDWAMLVPINFTWSLALNKQLTPIERHAVLYFIEQGLMPKTGKRFEWEVGTASGDPFSEMIQDYDWADEVLHAHIGREWYAKPYGNSKEAIEYGDTCWSKVLIDWASYKEKGLTHHANWWPGVYRAWCEAHGREPDTAVLAYDTSYAAQRADLKDVSVSA
jgi:hypothetical protein